VVPALREKRVRIGLVVSRGRAEPGCVSTLVSETLDTTFGQVIGSRSGGRSVIRMGPDLGIQSGTVLLASLGCGLCHKTVVHRLQPEWV
jgi:hypothetical protein